MEKIRNYCLVDYEFYVIGTTVPWRSPLWSEMYISEPVIKFAQLWQVVMNIGSSESWDLSPWRLQYKRGQKTVLSIEHVHKNIEIIMYGWGERSIRYLNTAKPTIVNIDKP